MVRFPAIQLAQRQSKESSSPVRPTFVLAWRSREKKLGAESAGELQLHLNVECTVHSTTVRACFSQRHVIYVSASAYQLHGRKRIINCTSELPLDQ